MLNKYIKILLSIFSVLNIYIVTNLSNKTIHNENNIVNYFILHLDHKKHAKHTTGNFVSFSQLY